jgi:hypothetical protein
MKRHRRKIAFGIVVLLALVVGVGLVLRRPSSAKELEAYKAELRAKGEKLSVKELTAGHSTNGMEQIHELLAIANRLPRAGGAPVGMITMQGVDTGKARVGWVQPMVPISGPRGTTTWDGVTKQLDATESLLVQMRKAIEQPDLASAWDPDDLALSHPAVPDLITKRIAAQWLAGAAIIEMHRGRLDEASEYLHSLAAFALVERDNPALISQMIRVAIGGLSISTTWELLQTNGWSDAQLARMQSDLEWLNLAAGAEKGMVGSRAAFAELMEFTARSGRQSAVAPGRSPPAPREPLIEKIKSGAMSRLWDPADDELFYLQNMQVTIEYIRALAAHQAWAATKDRFDQNSARLGGMQTWTHYRYPLSFTGLPNMNRTVEHIFRRETERELTVTAVALKRFQLRHSRPAPDLAALVPEFLSTLPYDPMSGKPLSYRLNADGTFVLYSVGEDGKDDGGDSSVARSEAPRNMWRGRDAVWPAPVW